MKTTLRSERGTNPLSTLIVLLIVLLIFELVVVGGRLVAAQGMVNTAAREAARRGTLVQNLHEVQSAVNGSATGNLAVGSGQCTSSGGVANVGAVGSPEGNFRADGSVEATVWCTVNLSDMSAFGVPLPNMRLEAKHTEIIETYRAIGEP